MTHDDVVATLVQYWTDNDPAQSKSGTTEGKMRRIGRRDGAVQALSLLTERPADIVAQALSDGIEAKLW